METRLERVHENLVFQMPGFIHDFGYPGHHHCPMVNPRQEHTIINHVKWRIHEDIEDLLLYPLRQWLKNHRERQIYWMDYLLSFLWGFICGFPPRDVALYTLWRIRGSKPVAVWSKKNGWTRIYP